MTNQDLVKKLQILKDVKPRKDWVILTKSQILGPEIVDRGRASIWAFFRYRPLYRPVLVTLVTLAVLMGAFSFAQYSLPGDILYPIKRVVEKSQAVFVSEKELPGYNLEIVNKRLEELNKIAETNQVKKLAPAMSEFQANVSEAAKNLAKVQKVDKEIVARAQKLEETKQKVEKVLATKIETEELDNVLKQIVEREIKALEEQTLTEVQEEILVKIKEDFEAEDYSRALEKILFLPNLPN